MNSKIKPLLFLLTNILVIMLLVSGFMAGRYTVIRKFKKQIQRMQKVETLEGLVGREEKKKMASAYYDEEEAIRELGTYSWAVPNVPTPFVGNGPRPGAHNKSFRINTMQFRSDTEIKIPKPPHIFRIFLTGGSTAYGTGSPDQERTIAGYLNNILNTKLSPLTKLEYVVLTMANPAWASTNERIIIENRLSELEPDIVISFSGNNDIHWGLAKRNILWFRSYYTELYWNLVDSAYKVSGYEGLPDVTKIEPEPIPCSLVAERLVKNVRLSSYALSLKDVPYIFFLQPNLDVTKKVLTERENQFKIMRQPNDKREDYFLECYSLLERDLDKLEIDNFHYVNLSDIFDDMGDEEIFLDSYHFGDRGNELIARNIFKHIKEIVKQ